MQFRLRTLLIAIAFVPLAFVAWPMFINGATSFDTEMQRGSNQIECGCRFGVVMDLLGTPDESSTKFPRALDGYKRGIHAADLRRCTEFHSWRNGSNWFYCIGTDSNGDVVLKAEGHS